DKVIVANETAIVAPLDGRQRVLIETVEPGNDRPLGPWTDCPARFTTASRMCTVPPSSKPFFGAIRNYAFGRPTTLENAWNIFNHTNTQLIHNQSRPRCLPPLIKHSRLR
ncbi:hypothetical protein L210DRAFT_3420542, partial [Boletus edulis BED1]